MRLSVQLLEEAGETAAQTPASGFPWTMVITLGISLVLVFVLIILVLPRKRKSPAITAMDAAVKLVTAAEALSASPSSDNLKKVRKLVAATDSLLVAAIYKGLVELNPAQAIAEETLKVCKSLVVAKADEKRRAEFAPVILDNAIKITDIVMPFAGKEVDDGLLALTQKSGANAYLDAVKAKHATPELPPEDAEIQNNVE